MIMGVIHGCVEFFDVFIILFVLLVLFFFFFKQKTAYEMRISDWSSDVCSSDLTRTRRHKISLPRSASFWFAPCSFQKAIAIRIAAFWKWVWIRWRSLKRLPRLSGNGR